MVVGHSCWCQPQCHWRTVTYWLLSCFLEVVSSPHLQTTHHSWNKNWKTIISALRFILWWRSGRNLQSAQNSSWPFFGLWWLKRLQHQNSDIKSLYIWNKEIMTGWSDHCIFCVMLLCGKAATKYISCLLCPAHHQCCWPCSSPNTCHTTRREQVQPIAEHVTDPWPMRQSQMKQFL